MLKSRMESCGRMLLGILWLGGLLTVTNASWFNKSTLLKMYEDAEEIYWETDYHWDFEQGYNDMYGAQGMAICFVEGPELDALVLGGSQNTTNVTLELQQEQESLQLTEPLTQFTVSLWYSFRPVDFLATINNTMVCDLFNLKQDTNEIKISYNGASEYNLTYKVTSGTESMEIVDDQVRPNWEFEVNDTIKGDTVMRGWQWNHVAMVFDGLASSPSLKAYFNGMPVNLTASGGSVRPLMTEGLAKLHLNSKRGDKPACSVVGFDEVSIWYRPLSHDDILALRLHVGRNRSGDREEPTTEAPTTTGAPTTTAEGTTAPEPSTAGSTNGTTARDKSSSSESQTPDGSTKQPTTSGGTGSTGGDGGESTSGRTEPGAGTSAPAASSAPSASTSSSESTPSGRATSKAATTSQITTANWRLTQLQNLEGEINLEAGAVEVSNSLQYTASVIQTVGTTTADVAEVVVSVLEQTAALPPATADSNQTTIDSINNFREEFVDLTSSLLQKMDESVGSDVTTTLVSAVETFLGNFVNDPTVTDKVISSDTMEVSVFTVDGYTVRTSNSTSLHVPMDAFGNALQVKVVMCIIQGHSGLLKSGGHRADVHTEKLKRLLMIRAQMGDPHRTILGSRMAWTDIRAVSATVPNYLDRDLYSQEPTWNLSSSIIILKTTGDGSSVNLSSPVTFTTTVFLTEGSPLCTYQDSTGAWSDSGLKTLSYDPETSIVTCETTHMTNFAVLMAVDGVELEGAHAAALSIISYIGCSLSLLCLTLALIIFILLRELNSTRMGIVKNLCVALFLAQLLFVAGIQTASANEIACKAVAAMLHYLFLCVISWMLCNGIYLYQKVNSAAKPGGVIDLIYFCILGWGAPAVVVAVTAGVNHKVYGSKDLCWLTIEGSGIWAFVIPAMLIILFNAFVTFLTMKTFVSVKVFKDKSDKDKFKSGLRAIIVMLPILGMSWIFGLLAFGEAGIFFQYLFAIFNSLQGVFLFIFHIFLNEEVKSGMRRRFGKVGAAGEENTLFNKIWAFSGTSNAERSTQMSSVTQTESLSAKPAYKN